MIERWISNDLTLKRWRRFKRRKLAVYSTFLFLTMCVTSFVLAPIISSNRPLYIKYQDKSYFPLFKTYHAQDFGITDSLYVDYKNLKLKEGDTIIWPLYRWGINESNKKVDSYPSPPTDVNAMGTDNRGRDVLTRLLYGFRYSIIYAIFVWLISFTVGTALGGVMGYFGGRVDFFGQRIVEIISTVPRFFLLIILISLFQPNIYWLIFISCLFAWIFISYYVRGEFLKNRKKEFVEAARAVGVPTHKIIFRHILPNSLSPVITYSPFEIASNITALASLDYLGFGLEPPTPSWGELLKQAHQNYTIAWWLALYPFLALFVTLTVLNLIGEGVRDAMDPNLA